MLDVSDYKARKILDNFWKYNIGLGVLKDLLEKSYKKNGGWIRGLDGRKIFIRSPHKLLNSLIQSTAAVLFKRWLVESNKSFIAEGLDARTIIAMHDEQQVRAHKDHKDSTIQILKEEANKLTEMYKLNVPVDVDCKVGMNWAETH